MGIKRKRSWGSPRNYVNLAWNGAKLAYSLAKRWKGGSGRTRDVSDDIPITNQYDSKVMYRRKRASKQFKRKAKKYKKFVKKVLAANDHRNEKQKVQFNNTGRLTAAANAQITHAQYFELYGGATGVDGFRDLERMITALGDTSTSQTRNYFRSAHLEASLLNTGSASMYVDMYHYICRKNTGGSGATPQVFLDAGYTSSPTNMGGSSLAGGTVGVTPFQSSEFCSYFKIIKKTSTLLGAGQAMDFQINEFKNRIFKYDDMQDHGCIKGVTRGVLLICYGVPNTATDGTAGQPVACSVNYNVQRSYTLSSNRSGLVDSGTSLLSS